MSHQDSYQKQLELSAWIDGQFKIEFPTEDRRNLIAMSCFDLAIEHHAGMCLLYDAKLYGPMFALLRVLFDGVVRGMWLYYCATEDELDLYEKDVLNKTFNQLVEETEAKIDLKSGPLSALKKSSYKIMNSFTHTGYQHLVRRNANGTIGGMNYPDEEINRLLICSGSLLLIASSQLAEMSQNDGVIQQVLNKVRQHLSN